MMNPYQQLTTTELFTKNTKRHHLPKMKHHQLTLSKKFKKSTPRMMTPLVRKPQLQVCFPFVVRIAVITNIQH
jgi:type VI protein secretion system component Hcp